jgi:hypothetical protein
MQISISQVAVGDTVKIICDGREYRGIIRAVNNDDSVTIRDSRESYGHKVYNEDIVKVSRYGAA